jgi:DNA sulfur modification protein DndD
MILKKILLHNFSAFEGSQEIDLTPTGNPEQNIILIGAMNGSGKTSLLEAVKLCLYGERRSGLLPPQESPASFIQKRFNYNARDRREREMYVELTFDQVPIPNSHEIKIRRSWFFDTLSNNGKYEDTEMIISLDGKQLQLVGRDQWQDFIDEKIPPGVSDFFFFDGEKIQQLADDSTDRDSLRESIRSLLGLKNIANLNSDLSTHIDYVRRSSDKVTDAEIKKLEAEEAELNEEIRKNQDELEKIKDELLDLKEIDERLEKEIRRLTGTGTENRSKLEQEVAEAERQKRTANDEILKLAGEILPFAIAGKVCEDLRDRLRAEDALRQWEASKVRVHPQLDKIVKRVFWDDTVNRPKPDITPPQKTFYAKLLTDEWEALFVPKPEDAADEIIHELSPKDERFVLNTLESISGETINRLKELLEMRERASRKQQDFNRELNNLPEDNTRIGQLVTTIREQRERQQHLFEQKGKLEDEITRFERDVKSIREKIENLKGKLKESEKARRQVELARKIKNIVADYERQLQFRKIAELEKHTTEMYKRLARKNDFVGEVKIDLSTFDVTVHDLHGNVKEKRRLSAGEKQIYAISLLWGLARTSDVELPIIIDTPFARLDSEHRTNIAKHYFPFASEQVIILSTDEEIDHRYTELLRQFIGKTFLIKHSDRDRRSIFEQGYFQYAKNIPFN